MRRGKGKKGPKKIKQVWRKKEPPPPPWVELPRDITANILHRLGAVEILENAQKVCTTWRSVCKDPAFWRVIDMRYAGDPFNYDWDTMYRHVVDRSQGQLIDINIEGFGTDELLDYIAERCAKLKCLRIAHCHGLSGEALSRFPLLEELHLFFTSVSLESLEMIGRSCPLLKSFSFNHRHFRYPEFDYFGEDYDGERDEEALTIAKSMPELRHLRLFENPLTNKGLQAILDSCPHLESLDLRQCYGVELGGDLGGRCSQEIKNLRRPDDSSTDYEFYEGIHDNEFCVFSDVELLAACDDEEYLDYDDFTLWDYDSDFEDTFGFY